MSCEEAPDFGTESIEVVKPRTDDLSAIPLENSSIRINWTGNPTSRIFDFRLKYDDISIPAGWINPNSWTEWDTTTQTSIDFHGLDEGNYTFYIQGRYDLSNYGDEATLSFKVDEVPGPALRIFPMKQTAQAGDSIDVYLYFEEVPENSAVTGLHVDIQINSAEFLFIQDEFQQGALITQFGATGIWPDPQYIGGTTMSITGVVNGGLSGTGSIAKFGLKILETAGTFNINIAGDGTFQNMNGESIDFESPVGGVVTVEASGQ